MYYQLILLILLFPWMLMALTVVGHLYTRWTRRPRPG